MGFALMGAAYVAGVFIVGGGVWLIMQGAFPSWWKRIAWPVVHQTRGVARLQGIGLVALGVSVIALVLTSVTSVKVGGALVVGAIVAYAAGLALFVLSTWMSRRPAS